MTAIRALFAFELRRGPSLNDLGYEALSNLQELAPSVGSPIVFAGLVLALALGAGLFASAVSESSAAAGRLALLLLLVVGTGAGATPRLVPHAERLHRAYGLTLPASIGFTTTVLSGAALSLLIAAWAASIRAPDDRRRVRRGLAVLVPFSLVTVAYALSILYAPLGVSGPARFKLPFGDDSAIGLEPAAGGDFLAHPVIVTGDTRRVTSQLWGGQHLFASRQLGVAVMDQYTSQNDRRWLALDRQGAITYLDVEDTYHRAPLGWSPQGRRFAWTFWGDSYPDSETPKARQRWQRNRNVIVLEEDLSLRSLELPATEPLGPWVASWIDDETLLITLRSSRFVARDSWWLTVSVHGEVSGPWPLEAGASLAAPALGEIRWFGNTALPLLEGLPAVVLESTDPGVPSRVVALDHDTGVVREGPEAELQIGSFGEDGVGGVVWLGISPQSADEVGESVWQLSALGAQPRRACTLPSGGRGPHETPAIRYFGTAGRWVLLKPGGLVREIYACDPRKATPIQSKLEMCSESDRR